MKIKNKFSKYITIFAMIIFLISTFLIYPPKAKAFQWYENLISDAEFTNSSSMSAQQIQNFLISNGSGLANYTIPADQVPGDPENQPGTGQKAADFIYQNSQQFGINPKVILVTLQKEESLITTASPSSIRLEWALGYGYYAGSPCADPNNSNYTGGFGRQIYWASAFFRNRFDNVGGKQGPGLSHAGDTIDIQTYSWQAGNTSVYLSDRATALLYRYTPYIYNGNYNFYTLYNQWFGSGLSWNYLLVKTADSPAIYLIDKGQKILIPDMNMFYAWGFNNSQVSTISDDSMNSYPSAANNLTLIMKGDLNPAVYYMNNGTKEFMSSMAIVSLAQEITGSQITTLSQGLANIFSSGNDYVAFVQDPNNSCWFANGASKYFISNPMMTAWGLSSNNLTAVSNTNLDNLISGSAISDLVIPSGYNSVWKISSGNRSWVPDPATLFATFSSQSITSLPYSIIYLLPQSNSISAIVKGSGPAIYLTGDGTKRLIPDADTFLSLGYSWSDIKTVPDYILNSVPNGQTKFDLVKGSGPQVYLILQNQKRLIADSATFQSVGLQWYDINQISDTTLNNYPTGQLITRLLKGSSPAIYWMDGGYKRLIPSLTRFYQLNFFFSNVVTVPDYYINYFGPGPGM
jgi:hypothetical protein